MESVLDLDLFLLNCTILLRELTGNTSSYQSASKISPALSSFPILSLYVHAEISLDIYTKITNLKSGRHQINIGY